MQITVLHLLINSTIIDCVLHLTNFLPCSAICYCCTIYGNIPILSELLFTYRFSFLFYLGQIVRCRIVLLIILLTSNCQQANPGLNRPIQVNSLMERKAYY